MNKRSRRGDFALRHQVGKLCAYCRREMTAGGRLRPTRDHCLPKSKGGRMGDNLVICCYECNHNKGDMTITEFHYWLFQRDDPRAKNVGHFIQELQWERPTVWEMNCSAAQIVNNGLSPLRADCDHYEKDE